ncbi:MAG TPA: CoA-binding protein [Candidatus Limnocylindrales bacterium]|nr:CoA-binding protein [Candidatus Limnocylindrales bacterium]
MNPADRARTIAYLDLAEGRGPVELMDDDEVRALLSTAPRPRIAVVGASSRPERASNDVMASLLARGFECVPVNPNEREVLGLTAYPTLAEAVAATGPVEIVDVFRRSELCPPHAHEAVEVGAQCLWLQLGVVSWEAAQIAAEAGLGVVMDRCLKVEARRLLGA